MRKKFRELFPMNATNVEKNKIKNDQIIMTISPNYNYHHYHSNSSCYDPYPDYNDNPYNDNNHSSNHNYHIVIITILVIIIQFTVSFKEIRQVQCRLADDFITYKI